MKYLCLLYDNEVEAAKMSEADQAAEFQEYIALTERLQAAGKMVSGGALQPVATATTVRVRGEQVLHTDGPFAETREQLGGYYLIEADTLDEALEWARQIPAARSGSVEVRPILDTANLG
ncbi:MAG: YciI family protein [Myxococcota bacterium]